MLGYQHLPLSVSLLGVQIMAVDLKLSRPRTASSCCKDHEHLPAELAWVQPMVISHPLRGGAPTRLKDTQVSVPYCLGQQTGATPKVSHEQMAGISPSSLYPPT